MRDVISERTYTRWPKLNAKLKYLPFPNPEYNLNKL